MNFSSFLAALLAEMALVIAVTQYFPQTSIRTVDCEALTWGKHP